MVVVVAAEQRLGRETMLNRVCVRLAARLTEPCQGFDGTRQVSAVLLCEMRLVSQH